MRKIKTCYGHIALSSRSKNTLWIKEYVSPDFNGEDYGYAEFSIFKVSWRRYKKRLQKESDSLRID